jgi:aspartate/methionine/tyrosine aminotransferase
MMCSSLTLSAVQPAIIPVVNEWIRNNPGTLSLGQGMVSYPPPAGVMHAMQQFGQQSSDHYYSTAFGLPALLNVIEAKLLAENAIDCQHGYRVIVTAGSNMAFLNALLAIVDPGDEVILPLPYYFNQEMAVRMLHCTPVFVPTDADYQLDIEALRAAITGKTRAIVTVSPNNPSGAVYPKVSLRAVNALCQEHGVYHISDEAYEYFTYDNATHFSAGSIAGAQAHTISLYSLSKAYGFASWRIGYMVVPEALAPALLKVQDTNLICPPLITQYAALSALDVGSAYCKTHLQQLASVRQSIIQAMHNVRAICATPTTTGGFYFLLKLHCEHTDLAVAKALIDHFKVATIPGSAFGLADGCYLRLSYGMLNPADTAVAMQRLLSGIAALCGTTAHHYLR